MEGSEDQAQPSVADALGLNSPTSPSDRRFPSFGSTNPGPSATSPTTTGGGNALRSAISAVSIASSLSPGSNVPSPALAALSDLTPLPSPLMSSHRSPSVSRRASANALSVTGTYDRDDPLSSMSFLLGSSTAGANSGPNGTLSPTSSIKRKKNNAYHALMRDGFQPHSHHSHGHGHVQYSTSHGIPQRQRSLRSSNEYHPISPVPVGRSRNVSSPSNNVIDSREPTSPPDHQSNMHREECLAEQRGVSTPSHARHKSTKSVSTVAIEMPDKATLKDMPNVTVPRVPANIPTPPPSNRSVTESSDEDWRDQQAKSWLRSRETFLIPGSPDNQGLLSYQTIRLLGQGAFSKVWLSTTENITYSAMIKTADSSDSGARDKSENATSAQASVLGDTDLLNSAEAVHAGSLTIDESKLDHRRLVAIKVVEYGPASATDTERIEHGLKREVQMLRAVSKHPSLVRLRAFAEEEYDTEEAEAVNRDGTKQRRSRGLLVLDYCAGGDLFDLASQKQSEVLGQGMVRRIFAELVDAVEYLHQLDIVHRDIKLENVLLNLVAKDLSALNLADSATGEADRLTSQTYPTPIVTLTDLGLSRSIPRPPESDSPLLTTRCGSVDYAAPELLLGQPYDGRATDSWALGVLLYSLIEGRLPFDPPPTPSARAARGRVVHRIARNEWGWYRFGDADGEWLNDDMTDESLDPQERQKQQNKLSAGKEWLGAKTVVENLLKKVGKGRWNTSDLKEDKWVQGGVRVEGGLRRRVA